MSTRTVLTILCLSFALISCEEASQNTLSEEGNAASTEEKQLLRQPVASSGDDVEEELSCLQKCGQEARSVVYANCLENLSEQQECATIGREWYRDCLVDRCDESAIQLDNCRTECRINGKKEQSECVAESNAPEDCRTNRIATVETCIAECN